MKKKMETEKKTGIWAITPGGGKLGLELAVKLADADFYIPEWLDNYLDIQKSRDRTRSCCIGDIILFKSLAEKIKEKFTQYSGHVFIFSTGIAVRLIAPLLQSKLKDPAVVVIDDMACHAISLVSGHIGNANALAEKIAELTGADPVITTATDVNHLPSIDMIAKKSKLIIENPKMIKKINMAFLRKKQISLIDPYGLVSLYLPDSFYNCHEADLNNVAAPQRIKGPDKYGKSICDSATNGLFPINAKKAGNKLKKDEIGKENQINVLPSVLCSDEIIDISRETLALRPLCLFVGIGCNRNTSSCEIKNFLKKTFNDLLLSLKSIKFLASSDIKQDEKGLLELGDEMDLKIKFYNKDQLNSVETIQNPSAMVEKHIGVKSVCEAAAILASENGKLVVPKVKKGNVTLAVARNIQNYL